MPEWAEEPTFCERSGVARVCMSSRRTRAATTRDTQKLFNDIEDLKSTEKEFKSKELVTEFVAPVDCSLDNVSEKGVVGTSEYDKLNDTEKAAANLGVSPNEWKPIGWLNSGHFEALQRANAMDSTLVRRIEAFKAVSASPAGA
jgi:hypothetical protein